MSPDEFRAAAFMIWGDDWQDSAGEFFGVKRRTILYWASGGKPVGREFEQLLLTELATAVLSKERTSPAIEVIRSALGTRTRQGD